MCDGVAAQRGGAVEARGMSVGSAVRALPAGGAGSASSSTAAVAICSNGVRTLVSGVGRCAASGMSLYPTIEKSAPGRSPRPAAAVSTPTARLSFAAKTAVGAIASGSKSRAPAAMPSSSP